MTGRRDPIGRHDAIGRNDAGGRTDRALAARAALRWGLAAAAVAAIHAGGVWAALRWGPAEAAPGDPPAPVMIELAPLAVAPDVPQQDVTPGPQMAETQPQPAPETPDKPPEEPRPDPDPDPTPAEPPPVEAEEPRPPEPDPEIKVAELPQVPDAAAVLAPPPRAERRPERPPERARTPERRKPAKPPQRSARQTTAPPTAQVERANRAAAPSAGAAQAPSISPATWRGALMAHLNRHKRFPAGAANGIAHVAFTIDRAGRVLSARLIRSSGDPRLDAAAVELPRRASPVPAPPADIRGATIPFTVPINYGR